MSPTITKSAPKRKHKDSKKIELGKPDMMSKVLEELPEMVMPYTTRLSFAPLLKFWESKQGSEDVAERIMAREIMSRAEKAPALWEPIGDYTDLAQYQETVDLLLAGLFPLNLRETQLGKACRPFDMNAFYSTPAVVAQMSRCDMNVKIEKSAEFFSNTVIIKACSLILSQHYGQKLDIDPTVVYSLEPRNGGGLVKHFKSELNINFVDAVPVKPIKNLTQEQINNLLGNIYDVDAWKAAIPPENFEFHGVVGMNLIDVTKEESISRIRFNLLEKDAIIKKESIQNIESLLRSYYGMPNLRMGIMALDYPTVSNDEFKYNINHCFLQEWDRCVFSFQDTGSVYEKAAKYQEIVLVEDLRSVKDKTAAEELLLELGIRSFLVAPLVNKHKKVIGLIELGSPHPYNLNSFTEFQLLNLLPLFNMAIERSREETDNKIEAVIREKFTAIHPSVEWRFSQAAFKYLNSREKGENQKAIEPITFDPVYPMYAQSDIISSSNKRNRVIQEDLLKNLQLIESLLMLAEKNIDFPLLDQYLLETRSRIKDLSQELRSSDESLIIDFIQNEIHPLLQEMANRDASVALEFGEYKGLLDPVLGVLYQKRKAYEQSVTLINKTISDYLEKEEERSQAMLPHYFEKYKTDGVQFELYLGQSILKHGKFNGMHLRNFRLWQMQVIVEITRLMNLMKNQLPMPLGTAQLVFVYGQPISIRFRGDDKRFDVDGAYNIRYEIIKKRIDKAMISLPGGGKERLTQEGKVAIVYASEKDKEEYMHYLAYLKRKGLIEKEIEHLELDKLQGVQGLKALRVKVK